MKRCCLGLGHVGSHIFIKTTSSSNPALGECPAEEKWHICVICGGWNCTHERDEFNEKIRQAALAALGQTRKDWWV